MPAASCSSMWPARTPSEQACTSAMDAVTSHSAGRSVRKDPSACPRASSAPMVWCAAWWVRVTASGLRSSATAAAIARYRARCCQVAASFTVGPGDAAATAVALTLMGLDFGLITMAAGRRGTALGIGAGLAAASYLLSSLATTISGIRPGRYLSLFCWSVGSDQISKGVSIADFTVLIAAGLCALFARE